MNLRPESLLAGHTVLHTRDAEALHAYIAGMEGCHERHVVGPGELEVELRHAALGRVDVGIVYHSVAITVEQSRKQSDSFLIQFPLSGRIDLDVDGQALMALPGKGAVISPSQHVRRTGQPGWTLAFRLAHDFVCQRLAHRLTRPLAGRLIFHPLINTAAAELCGFGLLVVEALDRGTAQAGGAVAQVLETGLVDLLLELQPHTLGRALAESGAALRSDRIQAVRDHLDRHLDEALTVEQLAEAAGCSVRSLQLTFVELCGMSPMEWARCERLSRARALLETGGVATTVAQVARRTGFLQLSRFAATYRARYGELPSETRYRAAQQARQKLS